MSNTNDVLNREAPKDHQLPGYGAEYPIAQWSNGYVAGEGALGNGGFELPLDGFQGLIEGQPQYNFPHQSGAVTADPGFLLTSMRLAIVQSYTTYFKETAGKTLWSDTPRFDDGYKSRVLYFCYAAEIEETQKLTPFILTLKSTVAQEFEKLLRLFREQVLKTFDRISQNNFKAPHYFFWIPVGSRGRVSYKDAPNPYTIAPPCPFWDETIVDSTELAYDLLDLAIPDYLFDHIGIYGFEESKVWREALINNGEAPVPDKPANLPQPHSPAPAASNGQTKVNIQQAFEAFLGRTRIELNLTDVQTKEILRALGKNGFSAGKSEALFTLVSQQLDAPTTTPALLFVVNSACEGYYRDFNQIKKVILQVDDQFHYPPEPNDVEQWQAARTMLEEYATVQGDQGDQATMFEDTEQTWMPETDAILNS